MELTLHELGNAGRCGNQLFQIASTIGLAHTHGYDPVFPTWSYQPWFKLPAEMFRHPDTLRDVKSATELVPHIDDRAKVYLQDHHLFAHMMPTIRRLFAPSALALETLEDHGYTALRHPVLAVHVRRGDNVPGQDPETPNKHLWHPLPPAAYYLKAVELTLRSLQQDGHQRLVDVRRALSIAGFSDEPEWVAENLPGMDYVHYGTTRPKEHLPAYKSAPILDWVDFHMLAAADMHVLSNSTFGIFAALMAGGGPVIYPWPIFGPNLGYIDASLLFPAHWNRLETASC